MQEEKLGVAKGAVVPLTPYTTRVIQHELFADYPAAKVIVAVSPHFPAPLLGPQPALHSVPERNGATCGLPAPPAILQPRL